MVAQEMALFADCPAQRGFEMSRVDDGQVAALDHLLPSHMELAWPVAPFAADRVASEDGFPVSVDRQVDRFHAVGMTEQALGLDRPLEMLVASLVAGRKVPLVLLAVPGDWRLKQPPVMLDQVRDSPGARTHGILHFRLHFCQDPPLLVAAALTVKLAASAPFDRELGKPRRERGQTVGLIGPDRRCRGDRCQ